MGLTRLQFVTEICDIVGKKSSAISASGTALSTRAINWLNFGQRRIARAVYFSELNQLQESAATVVNVKTYPLETGTNNLGLSRVQDINSIRIMDSENSWVLKRWNSRKFDRLYPRPENYSTARPTVYTWWGSNIELFRIPDAAYTLNIRYQQWPAELTTDAQVSSFENKDELIVAAGALEAFLALEESTDAAIWEGRFKELLERAKVMDEYEMDWEPEGEPFIATNQGPESGTPWTDPSGDPEDPMYGYPA